MYVERDGAGCPRQYDEKLGRVVPDEMVHLVAVFR